MEDDDYRWEEPEEAGESLPRRRDPVNAPRSRVRKFVYLVVALMPFVAFILLLPRGGEAPDEETEPQPSLSPTGITGTTGVQLAFPFGMSPPPPLETSPDPADNIALEAPGTTQCSDRIDNDRDGRIDTADPGCNGTRDNSESPNPVRRTTAPPPPPPVLPPPPVETPPPAPTLSPPPVVSPNPPLPPPSGPPCNPGDPGFPNCNTGDQDDGDDDATPGGETEDQ